MNRMLIERNMDIKGVFGDRNEENVKRKWRKGDSCYKVAKIWTELCSSVLWKVELLSDELGYLAEDISEQRIKGMAWFLLSAYSKMRR